MKYIKMLGLLAVAASALMAFAATASATTVTSPANTTYTSTIHATAGETTLHGAATITCTSSTVEGKVEGHGSSSTATGNISVLTFSGCGSNHVTVINKGSLSVHTEGASSNGNGTLTSTGATINIQITALGINCGFETNETDIGRLTGSVNRGGATAVLDIDSPPIPRHSGSIFCGSTGEWTGTYTVDVPDYLDID